MVLDLLWHVVRYFNITFTPFLPIYLPFDQLAYPLDNIPPFFLEFFATTFLAATRKLLHVLSSPQIAPSHFLLSFLLFDSLKSPDSSNKMKDSLIESHHSQRLMWGDMIRTMSQSQRAVVGPMVAHASAGPAVARAAAGPAVARAAISPAVARADNQWINRPTIFPVVTRAAAGPAVVRVAAGPAVTCADNQWID